MINLTNQDIETAHYKLNKGYALNNMGITKFWYFFEKSRKLEEDKNTAKNNKGEADECIAILEDGIKDIKNSIIHFEEFHERYSDEKMGADKVKAQQKMFIDEFFDTNIRETLPNDFKHYNLHSHKENNKMVLDVFTKAESCMPLANLGEICLAFTKMKEGLAFLDIALKLVTERDQYNLIRSKLISDIAGVIEVMGQTEMMIKMNKSLLENIADFDDYIKVFVLRNYGHLLTRHKEHEEEGKKYIHEADELDRKYPYWSERKMSLFTPKVPHEPLEKLL